MNWFREAKRILNAGREASDRAEAELRERVRQFPVVLYCRCGYPAFACEHAWELTPQGAPTHYVAMFTGERPRC